MSIESEISREPGASQSERVSSRGSDAVLWKGRVWAVRGSKPLGRR